MADKYVTTEKSIEEIRQLQAENANIFGWSKDEIGLPLANGWVTILFWPNGMACAARMKGNDMIVRSLDGVRKVYKGAKQDDSLEIYQRFADEWCTEHRKKKRQST